jgi:hypothetical protein
VAKGKKAKIAGRGVGKNNAPVEKGVRYLVVYRDDIARGKYHATGKGDGFTEELATSLAVPAHPDAPAFAVVTTAEYEAAKESESTVTIYDVLAERKRVAEAPAGSDADAVAA